MDTAQLKRNDSKSNAMKQDNTKNERLTRP